MSSRKVGRMGESEFSKWCAEAGITANSSENDERGWDFFLEFPFDQSISGPNIHKSYVECKIQVKATDSKRNREQITLSNMHFLAVSPYPTFFVFLKYEGKTEPQSVHVVHVDENLIERTLRRIASEEESTLNKRTLTVSYGKSTEVQEPFSNNFKEKLLEHIGPSLEDYIQNKKEFLESCGYDDDGGIYLKVGLPQEEGLQAMMDATLGLNKEINVLGVAASEVRFGVSYEREDLSSESAKLSVNKVEPVSVGQVSFKKEKTDPGVSFRIEVYNTPLNEFLPKEENKFRVSGQFFDVWLYGSGEGRCDFHVDAEEKYKIGDLKRILSALELVEKTGGDKEIILDFRFDEGGEMEFKILGVVSGVNPSEDLSALESTRNVLSYFSQDDSFKVSLQDIRKNFNSVAVIDDFIKNSGLSEEERHDVKVDFCLDEERIDNSKPFAVIFVQSAKIGDYAVGVFMLFEPSCFENKGEQFTCYGRDCFVYERVFCHHDDNDCKKEVFEKAKRISDSFDSSHNAVLVWD